MTTIQVLKAAREKINQGWVKGIARRKCGETMCYCATGAVAAVGPGNNEPLEILGSVIRPVQKRLAELFPWQTKSPIVHIQDWNDAEHRRKKDVLAAFDRAIRKAEKATA